MMVDITTPAEGARLLARLEYSRDNIVRGLVTHYNIPIRQAKQLADEAIKLHEASTD